MNAPADLQNTKPVSAVLPTKRDLYYGGAWHAPQGGYADTINPATGAAVVEVAFGGQHGGDRLGVLQIGGSVHDELLGTKR